jgi:hypothetical protein
MYKNSRILFKKIVCVQNVQIIYKYLKHAYLLI